MRRSLAFLFITLISCTETQKSKTKSIDFGQFTIEVPTTWQNVKANGIDSFVGHLALDNNDSVMFDLGWYSNSLEEEYNFKVEDGNVYLKNEKKSTPNSVFFDFYGKADTIKVEKFIVNKISWSKVDGRKAKIVQPKLTGIGMTGIYIDSLWIAGSGIDRFQMNGHNLHPDNEKRLLKAFNTIKFKK